MKVKLDIKIDLPLTQVFIRELISNASDALEKFRYMQMTRDDLPHGQPLEIHIAVDQEKSTFTIQVKTGILIKRIEVFHINQS